MPLIKRVTKCGCRSGFVLGFAVALVVLQLFTFSQVTVLFEPGESSAPSHREARQLGNEHHAVQDHLDTGVRDSHARHLQIHDRAVNSPQVAAADAAPHAAAASPSTGVGLQRVVVKQRAGVEPAPVTQDETVKGPKDELETTSPLVTTQATAGSRRDKQQPLTENLIAADVGERSMCSITGADALSCLERAKTKECRALIRNVTCLQMEGKLYDLDIPYECPLGQSYLGQKLDAIGAGVEGPTVRIAYVLTVHGRALRQLKMLFKAIYHRDNFYYIHVDIRADYLHREVIKLASLYPNVWVTSRRLATIWGGASLLQMLLQVMADLITMATDYPWDYLVNLSAADYPMKTDEELRKFLTAHQGKNFVKTHMKDTQRFIQKQGLDRTFVECDNHMWRVASRPPPVNIVLDGGSDWIIVHRDFVRYLVTSDDQFLAALKRYFQFTLLPAESFFHTVLRNGRFCNSLVTSNLHLMNWKRKVGCSCNYREVVDWCGCSPNDFLLSDANWLMNPKVGEYFARKFEPSVSHEVILALDSHLFGDYPRDTPGLHSYWESVYHSEDGITMPGDAAFTLYSSFNRLSKRHMDRLECPDLKVPVRLQVFEVTAYFERDSFRGYVVALKEEGGAEGLLYEVFVERRSNLVVGSQEGDVAQRLLNIDVGTKWDSKESMFRAFGGVIGPHDEVTLGAWWKKGVPFEMKMLWEDPTGEHPHESTMKIGADWTVSTDKLSVARPLKPGIWKIKVTMGKATVHTLMAREFLVLPLTHWRNKQPLAVPKHTNGVRAHVAKPANNFTEDQLEEWKQNVLSQGEQLENFVDSLVEKFWSIASVCVRLPPEVPVPCRSSGVTQCSNSPWSTLFPDPKSELGPVHENGRLR